MLLEQQQQLEQQLDQQRSEAAAGGGSWSSSSGSGGSGSKDSGGSRHSRHSRHGSGGGGSGEQRAEAAEPAEAAAAAAPALVAAAAASAVAGLKWRRRPQEHGCRVIPLPPHQCITFTQPPPRPYLTPTSLTVSHGSTSQPHLTQPTRTPTPRQPHRCLPYFTIAFTYLPNLTDLTYVTRPPPHCF